MKRATERIPILVLTMGLPVVLLACGGEGSSELPDADRAATPTLATSAASTPTTSETTASIATPDQTSVETDRAALVAFYNATDGPNWTNSDNWLSDGPLGEWHGVETFAEGSDVPSDWVGRVGEITLQANGLKGEIPAELAQLSHHILAGPLWQRAEREAYRLELVRNSPAWPGWLSATTG